MGGIGKAVSSIVKNTIGGGLIGGSQTKTPDVVTRNPVADDEAAQRKADEAANKQAARTKKRRQQQSLLSTAGERGSTNNGKSTLGS